MKKRMKRWLNALLAIVMVLGNLQYVPMQSVEAATQEVEYTYNFNQLTEYSSGWEKSVSNVGALTLTNLPQYSPEVYFVMPSEVDSDTVTKIVAKLSTDSPQYGLTVKAYDSGWTKVAEGWNGTLSMSDVVGVTGFSVSNGQGSGDPLTVTIESVEITDSTGMHIYTFNQLAERKGSSTRLIDADGTLSYGATGNYQEMVISYPVDKFESDSVKKVKLNLTSGSAWSLSLKAYSSSWTAVQTTYDADASETEGGVITIKADKVGTGSKGFSFQNGTADAGNPFACEIESVTFTVEEEVPTVERYYTFNDLTAASGSWGNTVHINSKGGFYGYYTGQYGEAKYTLPAGIDVTTLEKITLDVTEGDTSNMFLKLYADGTKVQEAGGVSIEIDATAAAALATATSVTIGIQSNASPVSVFKIDNILVKAVQTAGSETEPDTADDVSNKDYTFASMEKSGGYQHTINGTEGGKLSISYEAQYGEVIYNLPEGVDVTSLQGFKLNVSEGTAGNIMVKLYADGTKIQEVGAPALMLNSASVSALASAGAVTIGIMNTADGAANYVIDNITFRSKHTEVATVTEKYYTFNDLTTASGGWGNTVHINSKGGFYGYYTGQYGEAKYTLPAGIDVTTLEKITLDVTEGDTSKLRIKLYIDGANKQEASGVASMEISDATKTLLATASSVAIGIQSDASPVSVFKIDNILVKAVQTAGSETEPDTADDVSNKDYTFASIEKSGGYQHTINGTEGGKLSISYEAQYGEVIYNLPEGVDVTSLQGFKLNVSEGTAGNIMVKLYADGTKIQEVGAPALMLNSASVSALASAGAVTIGIMNTAAGAANYVIDSITFRSKHTEVATVTEKYYTFNDLTAASGSWGNTVHINSKGGFYGYYTGQYGEAKYTLPASIDVTTLEKITLDVTEGDTSKLRIKLYIDGANKQEASGVASMEISDATKTLLATASSVTIGIQSDASPVSVFKIDNILVKAVQTAGSETEPDTADDVSNKDYTFASIEKSGGYQHTINGTEGGKLSISYEAQYGEVIYNLPEGVDVTSLQGFKLNVSEGTASNITVKLYADGTKIQEVGAPALMLNSASVSALASAGTVTIGIMNAADGAADYVIDSITFRSVHEDTGSDTPITKDYTVTVWANGMLDTWTENSASVSDATSGRYTVTLPAKYAGVGFELPQDIDLAKCESIVITVPSQDATVNFFVSAGQTKKNNYWNKEGSTTYTLIPTVDAGVETLVIDHVGIQLSGDSNPDSAKEAVFEKVVFNMVGDSTAEDKEYGTAPTTSGGEDSDEDNTTDFTYTGSELTYVTNSLDATSTVVGTTAKVDFPVVNAWVKYTFPEELDLDNCESVTVTVSSQVGEMNFYLGDGNWSNGFYGQKDKTEYVLKVDGKGLTGKTNVMFVQEGGQTHTDGAGIVIEGVTIKMKETGEGGGSETPSETYDVAYTGSELTKNSTDNATSTVNGTKAEATLDASNAWVKYQLPEAVDLDKCVTATFTISSQDGPLNFYLGDWGNSVSYTYQTGKTVYELDVAFKDLSELSSTEIEYVIIQLAGGSAETSGSFVFEGVTFEMEGTDPDAGEGGEGNEGETGGSEQEPTDPEETKTYTKYYTFKDVNFVKGYGYTMDIDDNGELSVDYSGDYDYPVVIFDFPAGVDTSTIESLEFNINGETNYKLALKLFDEEVDSSWDNKAQVKWGIADNTAILVEDSVKGTELKYFALVNAQEKVALEDISIDWFKITTTTEQTGGSETQPGTTTDGEEGGEGGSIPAAQYTFNDVTSVKTHQATLTVDETTGVGTFAFAENYGQVAFTFPDDLDTSLITSLALVGEDVSGLSLKIYADETFPEDFSGEEKAEYSSSMSINTALTGTLKYFVIMNTSGAAKTFEIAGFDTTVAEELAETYEIALGANDLTWLSSTEGATSNLVGNAHNLTFATYNSDEVKFTLPEVINMEKCISMTVSVAEQVGPMNYYFYSGSTKIGSKYYYPASDTNEHVIEFNPKLTGKMDTIGIQLGGEENTANAQIKILGVTFVMEGTEPLDAPTDGIYTYSHFIDQQVSEGTEVEVDETDHSATITFAEAGDSIILPVPDAIDLNHLVSIDMIAEGAENTRIVLLDKDGDVVMSTAASTIATKCNPEIAYIKLVSTADTAITVDLTGFKFNVDPKAFESIILNGNFAREDVSMWKNALWGTVDGTENGESTTITAKTSETELVDGIYTYGEITRRSSPYVCFAQDVSDRVEPGKGYYVSAWVKLDEEDYAGADATLRAASLGIYYLDANGKENYGLFLLGDDVMVCEPGEWTFLWCRFNLPESATGCVVRVMEQGTNYGQGDCLMGSYAVTGVTMSEAPLLPKPTGGSGGGGTNTTITKETNWVESYDMDDLLVEWASATTTKSGSTLKMTFDNNYDEARMDLPRPLDASTMAYVKTKVSSNVPMAVKLYYKGAQVDVGYYNTIADEYILVPSYTGMVDAIGIMSLATPNPADAWATFNGIEFGLTQEPAPLPPRTSIVLNGDFSNEDLADWKASFFGEGVTMTRKVSQNPIAPGVYNYASYSKRTSPYQCFAQDITEAVEEGKTYTFSFWARLSSAYEGAPESQRIIQFAPYTVDSDGNADYNPKLDGNYLQVCEPGVWTYFEGTYKVTNPNDVAKVVIRILEQGTNYGQGECVLGGFDIADVKMDIYVPEPPSIDEDVPNLKDALAEDFGDDFYTGTAVTLDELDDIGVEMLVNKHFNAITLGNELKPDCLFNYSNNKHTELKTVTFNGQKLEVPTLYFYRADEMLDKILEWNKTHPESPILVKGHVLVWHSQTPEWFFREGYVVGNNADGTPNYVSAEEMDLRLEWFISEVFNHYLGEDSPYKDLFYAWDVVNEAVSNGNSGYRTDKASSEDPNADTHSSNSSWWAVYQSNEYIINAFKYANKYAPANVELYYNDYNECDSGKMKGIVQLLTDVKNAEGTRIDGMGMQGHYNMFNPSVKDIEKAIRAYAAVVGKVNYSELDMKVSGDVSSEEKLQKEYLAQAERYHDIYQLLLKLDAEEGIDISGITWWGTVDHHSWLQESSELGGGANGGMTQCPLLFDTKYKVKPSFWAFVDYTMVDPDWTPEGEETPVDDSKEDSKEESKEDVTDEGTASTEESKADTSTEKTEDTSSEPKERSVLPFALAGGAGAAIIAASAALLFRKKKN